MYCAIVNDELPRNSPFSPPIVIPQILTPAHLGETTSGDRPTEVKAFTPFV